MGLQERGPRPGTARRGGGKQPSWRKSQLAAVDEAARAQIVGIAAGNPLFLEQLLAFVQEAGPGALGAVVRRRSRHCSRADLSSSNRPSGR